MVNSLNLDNLYSSFPILASLQVNGLQFLTMIWNVCLALVPFFIYRLLRKHWPRRKLTAGFLFVLWLLFFPNSAYIMADARHLLDYCPADSPYQVCPANAWMVIFFFAFSASGWVLFYYNLKLMAGLILEIFNKFWSNIFILAIMPLTALGVLFGLLNRLNSWDAIFYPAVLWQAIAYNFLSLDFYINWYIFTVFFYLLYFAGDAIFRKTKF